MSYNGDMANKKTKLGWHFLPSSKKLEYGDDRKVEVGKKLSIPSGATVWICHTGMHASERITAAASFKKGPVLCRVEVSGDIEEQTDKFCGRSRTVLWMKELTDKDVDALAKHLQGSTYAISLEKRLHELCSANPDKAEKWLNAWAKKNGVDGSKPTPFVYTPPELTEKDVLSVVTGRLAKSEKEIAKDLKGSFTMQDSNGNDLLDELLDNLTYTGKLIRAEGWAKDGSDGFLRPQQ